MVRALSYFGEGGWYDPLIKGGLRSFSLLFFELDAFSFYRDIFDIISARASRKLDVPFISDRAIVREDLSCVLFGEGSSVIMTWGTFLVLD